MNAGAGATSRTSVRHATAEDAPAIATLMAELGYPDDATVVEARVARSCPEGPDTVFIAEFDGEAAGVGSVHLIPLFHRDGYLARITSFVVASELHGRGIGTALLKACERWAADHLAERVEITSGDERDAAHAFYERRGFAREGQRFSKWVRR